MSKKITIKCKGCGATTEVTSTNTMPELKAKNWGIVYDQSNGLTTLKVCPDCSKEIQAHAEAIEQILGMPFWKLSIPTKLSDGED